MRTHISKEPLVSYPATQDPDQRVTSSSAPALHRDAQVYRRLKAMLAGYRFKPGERLQINVLADDLRVSSTPVREALNRLAAENLLSRVPAKGFFAKNISLQEQVDLYRLYHVLLRHVIETQANPAAVVSTVLPSLLARFSEQKASLESGHERATSTELTAALIEQLFEAAAALSRNDAIIKVVRNIIDRTQYIRRLDIEVSTDRGVVNSAILDVFRKTLDRNTAAALSILDDLFKRKLVVMPQLVKEGIVRTMTR